MEYPLIRTFLDELPMDQLAAIESISPVRLLLHLQLTATDGSFAAHPERYRLAMGDLRPSGLPPISREMPR